MRGRADPTYSSLRIIGNEGYVPSDRPSLRAFIANRRKSILVTSAVIFACMAGTMLLLRRPAQEQYSSRTSQAIMEEVIKEEDCSKQGENCNVTKCCTTPGYMCYEKKSGKKGWASCRPYCTPGPDPTDPDPAPWTCKPIGPRRAGHAPPYTAKTADWVSEKCSDIRSDCSKTRCCSGAGLTCFRKNKQWSRCKPDCTPGPDPTDNNPDPWECKVLGGKTPGTAPQLPVSAWVKKNCSKFGENCADTECCQDPGHQCYEKDKSFATCWQSCQPGTNLEDQKDWKPWSCKELGERTPGPAEIPHNPKFAPWVNERCSSFGEDCRQSKCCKAPSDVCYERNKDFATCFYSCQPGKKNFTNYCAKHKGEVCDGGKHEWSCKELGPRTPRKWGSPTLYCMHVMRLYSYEADIIRAQLNLRDGFHGGIFGCDEFGLYASDAPDGTFVGDGPSGPVKTRHFSPAPVGRSKDGTAANTLLFMNVWEAVRWDRQYMCCDWVIKADPDAVLMPSRLRWSLQKYTGRPTFVVTCNKGFADGPMMFGAVEAISRLALQRYYNNEGACRSMPWQAWGEDLWMGNCLKKLGVYPVEDHGIVADGLCYGNNCVGNKYSAAFHPFKNKDAWMGCYWAAFHAR